LIIDLLIQKKAKVNSMCLNLFAFILINNRGNEEDLYHYFCLALSSLI